MQQPWANIFLRVNGDGDDALGLSVPELPVTPLTRSEFLEPVLLEQSYELCPRHSLP